MTSGYTFSLKTDLTKRVSAASTDDMQASQSLRSWSLQFHTLTPHFGKDENQLKLTVETQEWWGAWDTSRDGQTEPGVFSFEGTAGAMGNVNTPRYLKNSCKDQSD